MRFIKLTRKEEQTPIHMRTEHIMYVEPRGTGAIVFSSGGYWREVAEDPDTIMRLINPPQVRQQGYVKG